MNLLKGYLIFKVSVLVFSTPYICYKNYNFHNIYKCEKALFYKDFHTFYSGLTLEKFMYI